MFSILVAIELFHKNVHLVDMFYLALSWNSTVFTSGEWSSGNYYIKFKTSSTKANSQPRYLYELLYPWLINCLHRADSLLAEHIEIQEREKARFVVTK